MEGKESLENFVRLHKMNNDVSSTIVLYVRCNESENEWLFAYFVGQRGMAQTVQCSG